METGNWLKADIINKFERFTEMEEKIDAIDVKLTQVVDAILGNPLTKEGGFVIEINHLKRELDSIKLKQAKHDDFKKQVMWTIGAIVGLGLVFQYFIAIYSNLKK